MPGERRRAPPAGVAAPAAAGIVVAAMLAAAGAFFAWQALLLDLGGIALPGPGFFPLVARRSAAWRCAALIGIELLAVRRRRDGRASGIAMS